MTKDEYIKFLQQPRIDIEVTEEMIDAGFKVLAASGIAEEYLGGDRLLVAEIFVAMLRVAQPSLALDS